MGTEATKDLRGRLVGGAVGAVEEDPPRAQVEIAKALMQLTQIVLKSAGEATDTAHLGGRLHWPLEFGLDLVLGVIVELEAIGPKQLDPVVLIGIGRGRDDDAKGQTMAPHEQRSGWSWQHPPE